MQRACGASVQARRCAMLVFRVAIFLFAFHAVRIPTAKGEQARSAEEFADSVCVNTHFRFTGTAYQLNQTRLFEMLEEAGIYNVRDDSLNVGPVLGSRGIKMNYGLFEPPWNANSNSSIIRTVLAQVKTAISNGLLIDAILNVNEPDGMWPPKNITYNGEGFPNGTVAYMRDFWTLIRQDPSFDDVWVIASPLAITNVLPDNCCSKWIDFGDFHPYPFNGDPYAPAANCTPYGGVNHYYCHSTEPSVTIDTFPGWWNKAKAYYPNKPFFATETGYSTSVGGMGTSVRAQGLYATRIFTEFFRLGVRRTCIYELLDEHLDAVAHEANFGIVFYNYTGKPSYTAIKNLMALVRSDWKPSSDQLRPPSYSLKSLDFSLSVNASGIYTRTQYVHHLLLQKPDGTLLLLLWHEISAEDAGVSPRTQIYPARMPTVVTLPPGYVAELFAPNDGPGPSSEYSTNGLSKFEGETSISLMVPDHVIVLTLTATSSGASLDSVFINLWRILSRPIFWH